MATSREHAAVFAFLSEQLDDPETVLVLTPLVLAEFIHVVTDSRRHARPLSMVGAIGAALGYTNRRNVACLDVNEDVVRLGMDLLIRHQLGRKRISDTMLVASLFLNEVVELITCDPDDFAIFEGLSVIDPRR